MTSILIIDSDPGSAGVTRGRMSACGYETVVADTGAMAMVEARRRDFDLVLLGASLDAGIDAIETCRRLHDRPGQTAPVLVYDERVLDRARCESLLRAGCQLIVTKDQLPLLEQLVESVVRRKREHDELALRNRTLEARWTELEERLQRQTDGLSRSRPTPAGGAGERGMDAVDGLLIVDGEGYVRLADRGARELIGLRLDGEHVGQIAPASGLAAFVCDARELTRRRFRFELSARAGRSARKIAATVVPLLDARADGAERQLAVLLTDLRSGSRATATSAGLEPGMPPQQIGTLLDAARSTYRPESISAKSETGARLRRRVCVVGKERTAVLIRGEPGCGKEFVARILHYGSESTGAFLQLRCSALPLESLEYELFGYCKGAFAEAIADRPGLLALSHDGMLVLTEVGGLPLPLQQRVLAFLETSAFRRRGCDHDERVELRLVATTSEDLGALARTGRFLPELAAHFGESTIDVPPLRERSADIAPLANRFLTRFRGFGGARRIEELAMSLLERYDWPGNISELEDCIEQACRRAGAGSIGCEHLTRPLRGLIGARQPELVPSGHPEVSPALHEASQPHAQPASSRYRGWQVTEDDPISFDVYEKKVLLRALDRCGGDKLAAARLLNVGKSTLYRKLKRFGIA